MIDPESTPLKVMFETFKTLGVSYEGTAEALAEPRTSPWRTQGKNPGEGKAFDRSKLARDLRADPRDRAERQFRPFAIASRALISKVLSARKGVVGSRSELVGYLAATASPSMCASLDAFGISRGPYENTLERIGRLGAGEGELAVALTILFTATGCLGAPERAAQLVQEYAQQAAGAGPSGFHTREAAYDDDLADLGASAADGNAALALARITADGRKVLGHDYPLDPAGTEIGYNPEGGSVITDVDGNVSRRHLRIWRAPDGRWLARDLGSTNGTQVIDGESKRLVTIGEPSRGRGGAGDPEPRELLPGDVLVLGRTTRFLVIAAVASSGMGPKRATC